MKNGLSESSSVRLARSSGTQAPSICSILSIVLGLFALTLCSATARASVAYGTINNFDTVNDTGVECHGFEIEIEDIHSGDITYTYNWNHYGTPKITEDNADPLHPKVRVRYESAKNPDGTWAAYTAIPSGPIAPTDGHRFTDPSVNFGGEHFGAGYRGTPTNITYHWLIDNGPGLSYFRSGKCSFSYWVNEKIVFVETAGRESFRRVRHTVRDGRNSIGRKVRWRSARPTGPGEIR